MFAENGHKPADPCILTINGGSSSIKFALLQAGDRLQRILEGAIERIGLPTLSCGSKAKIRRTIFPSL